MKVLLWFEPCQKLEDAALLGRTSVTLLYGALWLPSLKEYWA
jgi:hypothetical protein